MEWLPIETAPHDGTVVRLKRVYQDRIIAEGLGCYGLLDDAAPSRSPLGPDPLGRMEPRDYKRERQLAAEWHAMPKWVRDDRMYEFPQPTHWMPLNAEASPAAPREDSGQ